MHETETVDASPQDRLLMESLGLPVSDWRRQMSCLGTVVLGPRRKVEVWVQTLPAPFWEFVVTRPREDGSGVEVAKLTTGSGDFRHYWPMAKAFADNQLYVEHLAVY